MGTSSGGCIFAVTANTTTERKQPAKKKSHGLRGRPPPDRTSFLQPRVLQKGEPGRTDKLTKRNRKIRPYKRTMLPTANTGFDKTNRSKSFSFDNRRRGAA